MAGIKHGPTSFETLAQRLVEGSFSRIFGSGLQPPEVATKLARALEDSQQDGRAADHYSVRFNPRDHEAMLRKAPNLSEQLAAYLSELALQAGLQLVERLIVEFVPDPSIGRRRLLVETRHSDPAEETTRVHQRVDLAAQDEILAALKAVDAFVIINGKRHVPLDRPVMTIGRRTDNDIIIDSPSVSRQHAQIRWRYGRFVIFDLGSRSGIVVNGHPARESVLQSGDVIMLSDMAIIYGEGWSERETERPRPQLLEANDSTMVK